jgi:HAD-superfamily phosphatase, subfamily IIIC/FkbH-like domain
MKYFIFRNSTIENLFGSKDVAYSGYDDISYLDIEAETYVWFYLLPLKLQRKLISSEIDSYFNKLILVYQQIPPSKMFVVFTLTKLSFVKFAVDDFLVEEALNQFNHDVIALTQKYNNVKVIDFSEFTSQYSADSLIDWKYYYISKIEINPRLSLAFEKWFLRRIEEVELKRKKCLTLDLDNTLWGGILGEDGTDGIKIGGDYPGNAFLNFQEGLIELSKNGVILTICSKNNEQDVFDAWNNNPFILLNQRYISSYRINWQNKAENIKELAEELNIGLDSFVFVDDNPTERELIKQMLPMVEVPDFPEKPYQIPAFFASLVDKYFRVYSVTEEDKNKTQQYKANAERKREEQKFTDYSEYLSSLNIEIEILKANDFNLSRIAQMTQKTNQFNLTTRRYIDADIKSFMDRGSFVYCINVKDKFGDNGITGCTIIDCSGKKCFIDSLLLSCRILGKGIEFAFMQTILLLLKKQGIEEIQSLYIPTKKNVQVCDFYDKMGFMLTSTNKDGTRNYSLELPPVDWEIEDYYHIIIN